jgi:hypothetical protein
MLTVGHQSFSIKVQPKKLFSIFRKRMFYRFWPWRIKETEKMEPKSGIQNGVSKLGDDHSST